MKTHSFPHFVSSCLLAVSFLVSAKSALAQYHPSVYIYSPTNGATFLAPANITIYARGYESNGTIQTVQFFAGDHSLGVVSNSSQVVVTNVSHEPLFPLGWSNVQAGTYLLKAIATDGNGIMATSQVVTVNVVTNFPPPPPVRPSVYIYSPTNGAHFPAPANLTLYARAVEGATGIVQTVEFFAGDHSLGVVPNSSQVVVSNISSAPLFPLAWSNVAAGSYPLRAVATDAVGVTATSSIVNITITTNTPPPPPVHFEVGFLYPTNGQNFTAPTTIALHAWVVDSNIVRTVQYFAGTTSLGTVSNTSGVLLTNMYNPNPFLLWWSNVTTGVYPLTAVASDSAGISATSAVVTITVGQAPPHTNRPPEVRISSPANAAVFHAPVNIPIYAYASDADGFVTSVEFRAGSNSLGFGSLLLTTNSAHNNVYSLTWSNAPLGSYALTAIATDNSNAVTVSLPVNISVLPPLPPPTNHVPIVSITATDPLAIEGTNCWVWTGHTNVSGDWTNHTGPTSPITNCGPKNATFSVYRSGDSTNDLTVAYSIGGTATNGVDYVALPGLVTIPAGQHQALITIVPLDDGAPDINSTVVLRLLHSTNDPATYLLSSHSSAEVLILDSTTPRPVTSTLPDRTFHLAATGPNGAWFHVEYSTDMVNWTPVCTNQVINGSIDFLDPDAASSPSRYYRAVPEPSPSSVLLMSPGVIQLPAPTSE
jgi:hypothetical protein